MGGSACAGPLGIRARCQKGLSAGEDGCSAGKKGLSAGGGGDSAGTCAEVTNRGISQGCAGPLGIRARCQKGAFRRRGRSFRRIGARCHPPAAYRPGTGRPWPVTGHPPAAYRPGTGHLWPVTGHYENPYFCLPDGPCPVTGRLRTGLSCYRTPTDGERPKGVESADGSCPVTGRLPELSTVFGCSVEYYN